MVLFNRDNQPDMFGKTLWMNPDIQYVFRKNIVEYDMQSASLSVSRRFKLLPVEFIDQLDRMPKDKRTKEIGMKQKYDKEFSDKMINGILQTRKEFIETNNLTEDTIITLHSDALMFIQKHVVTDTIEGVPFVRKNTWSSYIRYDRVEMFYSDGTIDYKGIPKQMLQQHTLGINDYLLKIFRMIEDNDPAVYDFIRKFQRNYLQDKLPDYYYIPFGKTGGFKTENLKLLAFIAKIVMKEVK